MRPWDSEILMGWYTADDQGTHSKGTMYLVLHPHGQSMTGRWVALSYGGSIVTSWASMAKTREEAQRLMHELKHRPLASA